MMKKQLAILIVVMGLFLVPIQTSAQVFGPISYVALVENISATSTQIYRHEE